LLLVLLLCLLSLFLLQSISVYFHPSSHEYHFSSCNSGFVFCLLRSVFVPM
jgi:hypothetical protein